MAQRKRKRNKKWIFRIIFVALLIGAIVVCYFVWDSYFKDKKDPVKPDEVAPEIVKEEEKKEKEEEKVEEDEIIEKEKVVQYDGDDPNEAEGLTGAVTYAGVSGNNLMIRVNIDQYLSSGKCTLGLWREGSNIYSAEAPIIDAASTSTCEGFNVPLSEIGSGYISIVVSLGAGEKIGEIRGEVNI